MPKNYQDERYEKCPIVFAMERIGSKWKIPILWNLSHEGGLRYNQLKRRVTGVTNTVLTRCLREMEEDGLLRRESLGSVPPCVTYRLTDVGAGLMPALDGLYRWGEERQRETRWRRLA